MRAIFGIAAALILAGNAPPASEAAAAKVVEARSLLADGRSQEALAIFREAVRLDPNHAGAHNALGSLLNRSGHYAEALPHAERAVALDPGNARYRYNRGVVRAEHGRFTEAIADFDAALAAHPDLTYAWLERGAAKLSLNDSAGARADWRKAAETDAKLIWPAWYAATGEIVDGRFAEAAAAFDRVAEAEPGFVPAKLWRAIAHGRAGKPIEVPEPGSGEWPAPVLDYLRGRISADALIRLAGEDLASGDKRRVAEAHFFMAQRALIQGDRAGAVTQLRKALAIPTPRHVWRIVAERDLARLGDQGTFSVSKS